MNPNVITVAWTIPYQPSDLDLHETEPELLVRVRVPSFNPSSDDVIVFAFERPTPWGTEYEAAYIEMLNHNDEPPLELPRGFDASAAKQTVRRPLPKRLEALALGTANRWERMAVAPMLAKIETDPYGEEVGLTVGYALPGCS